MRPAFTRDDHGNHAPCSTLSSSTALTPSYSYNGAPKYSPATSQPVWHDMRNRMTERTSRLAGLWIGAAISNTSHSNKAGSSLSYEHGSQVKDQGGQQCCHNKHKKFPYRPTRDVSLLSGHASYLEQLRKIMEESIMVDIIWSCGVHHFASCKGNSLCCLNWHLPFTAEVD